jgi:hypothetical protein
VDSSISSGIGESHEFGMLMSTPGNRLKELGLPATGHFNGQFSGWVEKIEFRHRAGCAGSHIWRRTLLKSMIQALRTQVERPWAQTRIWRTITWSAVLVLLLPAVYAQTSSSISGTVLDSANALVPGAKVTLTNEANKGVRTANSNGEGFFNFAAIPSGTYTVSISKTGFERWSVTGIEVHPGDSLSVPKIKLAVGAVTQSVTVTAEVAGVTLNSGEHSTLITSGDINRLSTTGRDVSELVSILPGFTVNAGTDVQNEGAGGLYGYSTMSFNTGVSSYGANGSAPQSGQVNVTADGANVIDPGDMGAQVANVNMDQVQEVKVETSNFGADQAKGPVVIDAVGKSGSDTYHGGIYTYFRNAALNSNDWLTKYYGSPRPENQYFYPGGTIGGPVKIPGTHFNQNKHLVFWAGYEYYGQNQSGGLATAFIPNAAMLGGDLSPQTIANALNVQLPEMQTNCSADWNISALYNDVGGICWSPNGMYDQNGATVTGGNISATGSNSIDPAISTITNLFPAANRQPKPVVTGGVTQFASDGINYTKNVMQTHNGFQFHSRVDENLSDTLKLYGVYNSESINDENVLQNIFYTPGQTVPYPTPMMTNTHSQYLTLDLTKTIGSSMTNEVIGSGVLFKEPAQFADRSKAQTAGTTWATAGYSGGQDHNGLSQLPRIIDYETVGSPSLSMGYVPVGGQTLNKFSWNVADNLTKQYRTHSIKLGIYVEETANNSATLGSQVNGTLTFMRWDSCYTNQNMVPGNPPTAPGIPPHNAGLGNEIGNLLIGCPLGYAQDNFDPTINVRFKNFEGYATDDWKVNSKLTLTFGIRISHMQPWEDAHGIGMAVWNPVGVTQHTILPDSADPKSWPGISWHGKDSSIPNAGVPTRAAFYSPRLGLAYDLRGNGKTVFRGGWGAYHSHDGVPYGGGAASTAIGLETYQNPSSITCTFAQLFNAYPTSGSNIVPCGAYAGTPSSLPAFNVNAMDSSDDREPVTYNYNFTIDQQGPWGSTFEVAYVGNQSSSISTLQANMGSDLQNQNVIPLNAFNGPDPAAGSPNHGQTQLASNIANPADYRPYPNYQQINVPTHSIWANYNALQVSWNKQRGSLVYGINYTRSKALGVRGSWDTGYIADPVNPHNDYGIVSFDRPQALNTTYSYQEGVKFHGNRILGQVINNWEISGITSISSGADLAVVNGSTNFGLSGGAGYTAGGTQVSIPLSAAVWLGSSDYTLQPTVLCDPRKGLQKNQFVNGSCFGLPAMGNQGQWNLPDVHGPVYFKSDLSVYKDITISGRQNMQFRLSGFNFLNHPLTSFNNINLSTLYLNAGDCTGCTYTTAGQALAGLSITNAASFGSTAFRNGVRIVELGFKYNF